MANVVKERPPRCAIASRAACRLLRLVPLQSPWPSPWRQALTAVAPPVPVAITNVRLIRHVESSVAQGAKVSTLLVLRSYIANKSDNTVDQIFDNCLKTWILNTFVETLKSRPYENFLANFCTSAHLKALQINLVSLKKAIAQAFISAEVRKKIFT